MSRSTLIGSYSERTTCPRCGDRIRLEDVKIFVKPSSPYPKCPACGTPLRVSMAYRRFIILITFTLGWLIPYLIGFRAYIIVAWVPFYLLACVLVPNIAKGAMPPRLKDADSVVRRSALRRNVELFMSIWLYWVLVLVIGGIFSGAIENRREFLKGVLLWLAPAFVAGTKATFIGISEIVVANSFIGAVCSFPLAIIFQAVFRRGHITQLGIYGARRDPDENDDNT